MTVEIAKMKTTLCLNTSLDVIIYGSISVSNKYNSSGETAAFIFVVPIY